ncbi:MFS transporter [Streptomyces halstedii]|uniref:MFS transporter n=1 Tax=Streptomyces halstedii TaxID=1944 RepID=A0A6N9U2M7_STRHA|nr:MFS transporter [Streptomyces halstedii]NEA16989.1 MFS transporter [Streptomyces halstedii]
MINRNFTLLWTSQVLSCTAGEMAALALPMAILITTHSPVDAGLVATAIGVAELIAKLPGGLLADTVDRRRLMMFCDAARAALALTLALALATGRFSTALAMATGVLTAVLSTMFSPAEGGVIRQIVPRERRREAVTTNIVRTNVAIAGGPPLGGALLGFGAPLVFLIDGASYLASFGLLSKIRYVHPPAPTDPDTPRRGLRHMGNELTRGIRWVFRRRSLLALIGFVAYLNLLGRAVELLAAVQSSDFGSEPVAAGVVLTAAGCGGIAGGISAGWVLKRLRPATMIGAVCGSWLLLIPLTATGHQGLTVVAVFALVFALPLIGALVSLSVMLDSPAHLQGRISTATTMLAVSIAWIGPGATGFLIAGPGAQTASLILAAPLAVMLFLLLTSTRLRTAFNTLSTGDTNEPPPLPTENKTTKTTKTETETI